MEVSARGEVVTGSDGRRSLHVDAEAANRSDRTYAVRGGCETPWTFEVERDGRVVTVEEPRATCLGFTWEPFPPGKVLAARFDWDGRVWDESRQERVDAPPDEYSAWVQFRLFAEDRTEDETIRVEASKFNPGRQDAVGNLVAPIVLGSSLAAE